MRFRRRRPSKELWRKLLLGTVTGAALGIEGVGFSDHWAYWQHGWKAVMVTHTAFNRDPHYHEPTDTPEKIDYVLLAMAAGELATVIEELTDTANHR